MNYYLSPILGIEFYNFGPFPKIRIRIIPRRHAGYIQITINKRTSSLQSQRRKLNSSLQWIIIQNDFKHLCLMYYDDIVLHCCARRYLISILAVAIVSCRVSDECLHNSFMASLTRRLHCRTV